LPIEYSSYKKKGRKDEEVNLRLIRQKEVPSTSRDTKKREGKRGKKTLAILDVGPGEGKRMQKQHTRHGKEGRLHHEGRERKRKRESQQ